jgi:hypothetical protein
MLGPRLAAAYQQLKGYFVASERFERQSAAVARAELQAQAQAQAQAAAAPPASQQHVVRSMRSVVMPSEVPYPAAHEQAGSKAVETPRATSEVPFAASPAFSNRSNPDSKRGIVDTNTDMDDEREVKRMRAEELASSGSFDAMSMTSTQGARPYSSGSHNEFAVPASFASASSPYVPGSPSMLTAASPSIHAASPFAAPSPYTAPVSYQNGPSRSSTPAAAPPSLQLGFPTPNTFAAIPSHLQPQPSPAHQYSQLSPQQQAFMRSQQLAGMAAQQQQTLMAQQHIAAQRAQQLEQDNVRGGRPDAYAPLPSPRLPSGPGMPSQPPRPMSAMSHASYGSPAPQQQQYAPSNYPDGNGQQQHQGGGPPNQGSERALIEQYSAIQAIILGPTFSQLPPNVQHTTQANAQALLAQLTRNRAASQGMASQGISPGGQQMPSPHMRNTSVPYMPSPQLGTANLRAGSGSYAGSPPAARMGGGASVESSATLFREQ